MITKLIICTVILFLAAGTLAQNEQALPAAGDKGGPVFIHGEPVYRAGGDVIAPRAIFLPDPEYSEEARQGQLQGTCLLWMVVGTDGKTHDVRIVRSLGMGLDEKSVEAIRTWRFEPATKNGQTVAVQINVETSFRLYSSPGLPPGLDGEPFQLPQKHPADYPLLLQLRFVTGKRSAEGYVVTAEATIAGDAQPGKVIAMTCGPKAKCFMLRAANYPARWVSSTEVELLGLNEDNRKWQKVHFSARPAF
ncbi:MAG: energy transducer TonB [Acidobacteriia bacterium]|nr:energy transducer TonB [Terriglobia bacterium]